VNYTPEQLSDPLWRLNNLYSIVDANGLKVRMRLKPQQLHVYQNMWFLNVILKARQIGFTTFIQLFMLDRCLFNANTRAGVIAHTVEDAATFFDSKIKFAYDNLPGEIKQYTPARTSSTRELSFGNGSKIRVGTSMRSGSLNYLHVSEFGIICARYPDKAREVISGSLNTLAPGQFVFIESTAAGRQGAFYRICTQAERMAVAGQPLTRLDYRFFFFPWHEEPRYALPEADFALTEDQEDYFAQLKAEEGVDLTVDQKRWYVKKSAEQGSDMKQEFPSTPKEAFDQHLEGAIFAQQMSSARDERRIGEVPWVRGYPVNTFWDLGHNDTNCIWFHQRVDNWDHFIHYYEHRLVDLTHYVEVMQRLRRKRGWVWGTHYLPHDGRSRRVESIAGSASDVLRSYGFRVRVVPRTPLKMKAIEETRKRFPQCRFDARNCARGIDCLDGYMWRWDEKYEVFRKEPTHNHASNGADAFQTFGAGYRGPSPFESSASLGGLNRGYHRSDQREVRRYPHIL